MAVQVAIVGASPLSAALAKLVRDGADVSLALWAERTTADHVEQTVGRDGVALLAVPPGESREFVRALGQGERGGAASPNETRLRDTAGSGRPWLGVCPENTHPDAARVAGSGDAEVSLAVDWFAGWLRCSCALGLGCFPAHAALRALR